MGYTAKEVDPKNFCEHVVQESLPKPGDDRIRGFEVCPYCENPKGVMPPAGTKFKTM